MMTTAIFIFWVLTTVNCQLAFLWLNNQHFQCSQNTRNYREAVQLQYFCTSSLTRICVLDVNVYTHRSGISLGYFCGFIDGQNALQPHTTWNIDLKPNIHIHFLEFSLSNNYWYCDYEYLRVYSNNQTNTFCGSRLPWVYDASDTKVKIVLVTPRFGTEKYQLQLQYYGANVLPSNKHSVIFTQASFMVNMLSPVLTKMHLKAFILFRMEDWTSCKSLL